VLFVVGLYRLFSVTSRMNHMCPRYVGMVRRFLVLSGLVVFRCFTMVTGGVNHRQNSDGNVTAKLNKPSVKTAANAAVSVMCAEKTIAPVK
jgi:hypothetical protein